MYKKEIKKYFWFKSFQSKRFYHFIVIPVLTIAVYLVVYYTDNKVYGHAMYIPIIYASFTLGLNFSIIVGIVGGIILGPLTPFSVQTGEPQETIQWIFRLIIYTAVGFFSGLLINILKRNSAKIIDLLSLNQDTFLPNKNGLRLILADEKIVKPKTFISIHINNYEVLLDLFGTNLYHKLIREIAKRIKEDLPNAIVIHPDDNKLWVSTDYQDKDFLINTISSRYNNNIILDGLNFFVDSVIGICTTCDQDNYKQAFLNADTAARYALKQHLPFSVYDRSKIIHQKDFELLSIFPDALNNGEIYLDYQPIINLENNKIEKFEALVRWNHPERGLISPDEFIPIIEQTKHIHALSLWVVIEVIDKIREFEENNIHMKFSINISASNLYSEDFIDNIIKIKKELKIQDNQIELELTESVELVRDTTSIEILTRLKNNGFLISIDDFGKGYSSLSCLHMFPASTLKIDKYFSKQLIDDPNVIYIVEGVIVFAHKLGIKTVFEGIETEKVDNKVREIKSDYAQGFYYSKPINYKNILSFYKQRNGIIKLN